MVGDIISKLREQAKLTQGELAIKIGISRASLSHYETNRREPDYETLIRFVKFFGVTTDYILGYTNDHDGLKVNDDFIKTHIKPFIISIAKENPIYDSNFLEYVQNASSSDYWTLFNNIADLRFENDKPVIKLKKISSAMAEVLDKLKILPPEERKILLRILVDEL